MLELDRLRIVQGAFVLEADLAVGRGSKVAVIGPSGAGKSTLLLAIAGMILPDSGRIRWDGMDLADTPPGKRPVTILFQDQNLFPHLSVADNVGLGLSPSLHLTVDDREAVDGALARTGLEGLGERKPGTLSGGQQSRVAIARALLRARPLMLLDEPFAALGPALKEEMLALVGSVAAETGATVLTVSHDPEDAIGFADEVILVANGVATPPSPTQALFADPPEALRDYLGAAGRKRL